MHQKKYQFFSFANFSVVKWSCRTLTFTGPRAVVPRAAAVLEAKVGLEVIAVREVAGREVGFVTVRVVAVLATVRATPGRVRLRRALARDFLAAVREAVGFIYEG